MASVEIHLTFTGDRTTSTGLSTDVWLDSSIAADYPEAASAIIGSITEPTGLAPRSNLSASSERRDAPPDREILRFFSWGEYEHGLGFGVPSFAGAFYEGLASLLSENGATWRWDVHVSVFSLRNQFFEGSVALSPEHGLEWALNELADDDPASQSASDDVDRPVSDPEGLPSAEAQVLKIRNGIERSFIEDVLFGDWTAVQRVELGVDGSLTGEQWQAEDEEDEAFDGQPTISIKGLEYPLGIFVEDTEEK